MNGGESRLDLLLFEAEERRPALSDGLPGEAAEGAPNPNSDDTFRWERPGAAPNDLAAQRWGVVAPEGPEGDRMLEAMQPLIALREREQGVGATIYRVGDLSDPDKAGDWVDDVYRAENVRLEDLPWYVLLLGDFHQTSVELQHVLATGALVGRVHFANEDGQTDLDGYAAYANKVVRFAGSTPSDAAPELLFYTAPDGSPATVAGGAKLVTPCLDDATKAVAENKLAAASVRRISAETVDELLAQASSSHPAVMLSVSHGMGPPKRGWKPGRDQRLKQGALVINYAEVLDAERLRGQPFLPGGMWFYLACFGAGTPATSAYHEWLAALAGEGRYGGNLEAVLQGLPKPGDRPFVAALPQAALANEEGPLAVIGHVDLAWTYSFSGTKDVTESKKSRIYNPLKDLSKGDRAGIALHTLMKRYGEANDRLNTAQKRKDTSRAELAHRWMLRNDLRGYVLLGDPAARLPLAQLAHAAMEAAPPEVRTRRATLSREEAVETLRLGEEPPRAIADRAGVSLPELWGWFHADFAARKDHEAI